MHRQCAGLPGLKSLLERGSISEIFDDVKTAVRQMGDRIFAPQEEEAEEADEREEEPSSSSSGPKVQAVRAQDLQGPAWTRQRSEAMTKYMFLDDGEKGTVKIYVKAEELQLAAFEDAFASFEAQRLVLLVLGSDKVFSLQGRLHGAVDPEECSCVLSASGHKVAVTLRKFEAKGKWHRLFESTGKELQEHLVKDFI
ncbi:unnamed protein product [Effrenium voratum]|uniref:CS domain-containing protein n=1 Tax=Effrenium voratum TaxID=2562239 RepID=A0AA36IXP4_9DINO|nr:unnamed protein product [Effrenium voratum]CAJ1423583.1 unnamed protein product [Effrenium voratum]